MPAKEAAKAKVKSKAHEAAKAKVKSKAKAEAAKDKVKGKAKAAASASSILVESDSDGRCGRCRDSFFDERNVNFRLQENYGMCCPDCSVMLGNFTGA